VKRIKPSHVLRTPPAIAIQQSVVDELKSRGCRRIRVEIIGGNTLTVDFPPFLRKSFQFDRGFGPQRALALDCWDHADSVQSSLFEEVG
jgi:hypothetical protein